MRDIICNSAIKKVQTGKRFLVKYSDSWAGEMVIEGISVFEEEELDRYLRAAKRAFVEEGIIYFGIGSNEQIEYESFEEFKSTLKIVEISEEQAITLLQLNIHEYGLFPGQIIDDLYEDKNMSLNEIILQDLENLVNIKFKDEDNHILEYSENGESLCEAIQDYLEDYAGIQEFNVDTNTIFESPGYDTGIVTISWINKNGELGDTYFQWERC